MRSVKSLIAAGAVSLMSTAAFAADLPAREINSGGLRLPPGAPPAAAAIGAQIKAAPIVSRTRLWRRRFIQGRDRKIGRGDALRRDQRASQEKCRDNFSHSAVSRLQPATQTVRRGDTSRPWLPLTYSVAAKSEVSPCRPATLLSTKAKLCRAAGGIRALAARSWVAKALL